LIADLGSSARSFKDGSVFPGVSYNYTLTASNPIGTGVSAGPSSVVAAITPSMPSLVNIAPDASSVMVSWTPPASDGGTGLTGYNVYRSTGTGWALLCSLEDPTTLSYIDRAVQPGTAFQYRVAAINAMGEGPRSSPTAKIVPLSGPSPISMTAKVGNSNDTLEWNSSSGVKAGQVIAMSIGQSTAQDTILILMELSLFICTSASAMIIWGTRNRISKR
jgi:hypothetical protein